MSRLGIYADKINAIREQRGLTRSGFTEDGTDAAGADKEAMLRELYRRADARLPSGIGGPPANDAGDTEGQGDYEGQ
ncbi:hypothetical protein FIU85_01445 [Roseovarius sp. THAF8]|uniref:hypothetical protein n=1 Tax=Roseovarius sp. THAF8 TaxID=2587846 RepID=UPI00126830CF|nr:hypothetical protein [Roseovarius sp. THAF8]QFT95957.1 hypothetical protein FIU85_01445 [Roseovarius sp. THAF8]